MRAGRGSNPRSRTNPRDPLALAASISTLSARVIAARQNGLIQVNTAGRIFEEIKIGIVQLDWLRVKDSECNTHWSTATRNRRSKRA
jgi:hypothetical protein